MQAEGGLPRRQVQRGRHRPLRRGAGRSCTERAAAAFVEEQQTGARPPLRFLQHVRPSLWHGPSILSWENLLSLLHLVFLGLCSLPRSGAWCWRSLSQRFKGSASPCHIGQISLVTSSTHLNERM